MLGLMLLAPAFKVMADSSGTQTSESHQTGTESGNNSSNDSNNNGISDSQEKSDARQVSTEVNAQNGEAQIQSQLRNGTQKNSFEFHLETGDNLQFSFDYKSQANSTRTEVQMKFEFRSLIEFIDNTSNPTNIVNAFDSKDQIVQQIQFNQLTWHMFSSTTAVGNNTVYNIIVNGTYGSMVVTFSFFVSTGFVNEGTYTLTPNVVKFTVQIQNFPFKVSNSLLATQVQIKNQIQSTQIQTTTENHKDGFSGQEHQLSFANNTIGAFFSWATSYLANGVNNTVIVSPVTTVQGEEGVYGRMYFNFAHVNNILWDPQVGVTLASISGLSTTPGFEFLGILVLPIIGLITIAKRRKLKKN